MVAVLAAVAEGVVFLGLPVVFVVDEELAVGGQGGETAGGAGAGLQGDGLFVAFVWPRGHFAMAGGDCHCNQEDDEVVFHGLHLLYL